MTLLELFNKANSSSSGTFIFRVDMDLFSAISAGSSLLYLDEQVALAKEKFNKGNNPLVYSMTVGGKTYESPLPLVTKGLGGKKYNNYVDIDSNDKYGTNVAFPLFTTAENFTYSPGTSSNQSTITVEEDLHYSICNILYPIFIISYGVYIRLDNIKKLPDNLITLGSKNIERNGYYYKFSARGLNELFRTSYRFVTKQDLNGASSVTGKFAENKIIQPEILTSIFRQLREENLDSLKFIHRIMISDSGAVADNLIKVASAMTYSDLLEQYPLDTYGEYYKTYLDPIVFQNDNKNFYVSGYNVNFLKIKMINNFSTLNINEIKFIAGILNPGFYNICPHKPGKSYNFIKSAILIIFVVTISYFVPPAMLASIPTATTATVVSVYATVVSAGFYITAIVVPNHMTALKSALVDIATVSQYVSTATGIYSGVESFLATSLKDSASVGYKEALSTSIKKEISEVLKTEIKEITLSNVAEYMKTKIIDYFVGNGVSLGLKGAIVGYDMYLTNKYNNMYATHSKDMKDLEDKNNALVAQNNALEFPFGMSFNISSLKWNDINYDKFYEVSDIYNYNTMASSSLGYLSSEEPSILCQREYYKDYNVKC